MPKKQKKINAVMHIPNEAALENFRQETDRLFAYTVKKYLDSLSLGIKEKQEIINRLISKLK